MPYGKFIIHFYKFIIISSYIMVSLIKLHSLGSVGGIFLRARTNMSLRFSNLSVDLIPFQLMLSNDMA